MSPLALVPPPSGAAGLASRRGDAQLLPRISSPVDGKHESKASQETAAKPQPWPSRAASQPPPGLPSEDSATTAGGPLSCRTSCNSRGQRRTPRRPAQSRGTGGSLGQPSLITVCTGLEPVLAPYLITVQYDLRPVLGKLTGKEGLYLAALDTEKLRRRGAGTGLDAFQASESWIARDCICSASGKLKPLTSWKCPGEVRVSLAPCPVRGKNEACVILRVVAIRNPQDPHDWFTIGSSVVLRVDTQLREQQQPTGRQSLEFPSGMASVSPETEAEDAEESFPAGLCGLPLQSLLDFYADIEEDLQHYCNAHRICTHAGRYQFQHVCVRCPCPYRPIDKPKWDDHRGIPFVLQASLNEEESQQLVDVVPDMHLFVRRYIWPSERGTGLVGTLTPCPRKGFGAYVSHSWGAPVAEILETLQRAVDKEDLVFVPGFMMGAPDSTRRPSGGTGKLDKRVFAAALRKADRLLVVADSGLGFTHCLWCCYEVLKAKEWSIPISLWPHPTIDLLKLKDSVEQLDLAAAASAVPSPSAMAAQTSQSREVQEQVELAAWALEMALPTAQTGSDAPEACTDQLKSLLRSRIVCYAAALQRAEAFSHFSWERLRHLQSVMERKAILHDVGQSHTKREAELEAALQEKDKALQNAEVMLNFEVALHRSEVEQLEEQLHKLESEHNDKTSNIMKLFRDTTDRAERLARELEESKASLQDLKGQLMRERLLTEGEKRRFAEENRRLEGQRMWTEELRQLAGQQRHCFDEQLRRADQQHQEQLQECQEALAKCEGDLQMVKEERDEAVEQLQVAMEKASRAHSDRSPTDRSLAPGKAAAAEAAKRKSFFSKTTKDKSSRESADLAAVERQSTWSGPVNKAFRPP